MTLTERIQSVATALSAVLVGAAGVTVGLMAYAPADDAAPRTVILGTDHAPTDPAEWTTSLVQDGWETADAAQRRRVCSATPAELRAAAPTTQWDPALYRVETVIVTLDRLCGRM